MKIKLDLMQLVRINFKCARHERVQYEPSSARTCHNTSYHRQYVFNHILLKQPWIQIRHSSLTIQTMPWYNVLYSLLRTCILSEKIWRLLLCDFIYLYRIVVHTTIACNFISLHIHFLDDVFFTALLTLKWLVIDHDIFSILFYLYR